jgi:hypothetical protein
MAKADAHFVDADINPLTPDEWTTNPLAPNTFPASIVCDNSRAVILDADFAYVTALDPMDPVANVGMMAADMDINGNIIIGLQPTGGQSDIPLVMYDSDYNELYRDFEWDDGVDSTKYIVDVCFNSDGTAVYAKQQYAARFHRWTVSTRARDWFITLGGAGAGAFCIHPNIDGAICSAGLDGDADEDSPAVFDSDGDVVNAWTSVTSKSGYEIACSLSYAYMVRGGDGNGAPILYRLNLNDYSDVLSWTPTPIAGQTYGIGYGVVTYGAFVYVFTSRVDGGNIWKLDEQLNVDAQTTVSSAREIWIDWRGRLAVKQWPNDLVVLDTDDLSVVTTVSNNSGPSNWANSAIYNAYTLPSALRAGFSPSYLATSKQVRTVAYPQNWAHLNGESVCILADGAVHPKRTVSGGAVTLDYTSTTNHIGLCYDSRLQPMKLDGEVQTKRIFKLLLQLYNSLGGQYGESESNLDKIVFRTTDNNMNDSPDLFSGHKELSFDGSNNRRGDVWIKQTQPLPMTVTGMIAKARYEDGG